MLLSGKVYFDLLCVINNNKAIYLALYIIADCTQAITKWGSLERLSTSLNLSVCKLVTAVR